MKYVRVPAKWCGSCGKYHHIYHIHFRNVSRVGKRLEKRAYAAGRREERSAVRAGEGLGSLGRAFRPTASMTRTAISAGRVIGRKAMRG